MSTCLDVSLLLSRPNGPVLVMQGMRMAIESCRCDIESECTQHLTEDHIWWDTASGLFDGPCENDLEFRQMRADCVQFLDDMGQITRHPDHPTWVAFIPKPN